MKRNFNHVVEQTATHTLEYYRGKYPYSLIREKNGNIIKYDNCGGTSLLEVGNPNDEDLLFGFYVDPLHLIKNEPTNNKGLGQFKYKPISTDGTIF